MQEVPARGAARAFGLFPRRLPRLSVTDSLGRAVCVCVAVRFGFWYTLWMLECAVAALIRERSARV